MRSTVLVVFYDVIQCYAYCIDTSILYKNRDVYWQLANDSVIGCDPFLAVVSRVFLLSIYLLWCGFTILYLHHFMSKLTTSTTW